MGEVTMSVDLIIGLALGVLVPLFLWASKMYYMTKQLRDMHLSPDEHDFGSNTTHDMLEAHFKTEAEYHQAYIDSNKALRYVVRELSHFMRWMVKQQTGVEPPPYVRKNGE
jgi:hypothetical protein